MIPPPVATTMDMTRVRNEISRIETHGNHANNNKTFGSNFRKPICSNTMRNNNSNAGNNFRRFSNNNNNSGGMRSLGNTGNGYRGLNTGGNNKRYGNSLVIGKKRYNNNGGGGGSNGCGDAVGICHVCPIHSPAKNVNGAKGGNNKFKKKAEEETAGENKNGLAAKEE